MNGPVDARLQRLLGGEPLASLRRRLRRRFERAPDEGPLERIRIGGLAAEEHAALASLLGRPPHYANSLQIDVRLVDDNLRNAGIAASLRDALEQLDGRITNIAVAQLIRENLWTRVVEGCGHPDLKALLQMPEGIALLRRLARRDASDAAMLCRDAEMVLRRLPANGIARAQLAAEALGDAHALDNGRPVATIVFAVWRRRARVSGDVLPAESDPQRAGTGERTRDVWARAGVLVNELARPALFLNLPPPVAGAHHWHLGEPAYLSLRALLRSPPIWDVAGRLISVCENPNLLAIAANHWGANCAPIVCVDGMPAAAQRCLLSQLAQAGARLRYHGDFDWPGIQIGNYVMRGFGAKPWRFGVAEYVDAVRATAGSGRPLEGRPVEASWDISLAEVMRQRRMSIAEEALSASLLRDLDGRPSD